MGWVAVLQGMCRALRDIKVQGGSRASLYLLACCNWLCCCAQDVLWWALYKAENLLLGSWLRKSALHECMKHIHYEASASAAVW